MPGRIITLLLLPCLGASVIFAAGKKYDERGNPIIVPAAEEKNPASAENKSEFKPGADNRSSEAAPQIAAPESASAAPESTTPDENENAVTANPLTKVYLENAQLYLRSERGDKALEMLKKSQEAGDDNFSREARLQSLWLRARRGDTGLAAEVEALDEKQKAQGVLRLADGYESCARESLKKSECAAEAERSYAYLAELSPASAEGRLAALRLAQLLVNRGRLEAALPHLTRVLAGEKTGRSGRAGTPDIPYDRAWFNLGQLYERPWYHRNTHKAAAAYRQVLKYPASPYLRPARDRLQSLERFGTGYPRP